MTAIRCSSLPLVSKCAQSLGAVTPTRVSNEAAREGTAVHALMAHYIDAACGSNNIDRISKECEVDANNVEMLYRMTVHAWSQVSQWFRGPLQAEQYLEAEFGGITLTGHFDVLALNDDGTEATICDFKTGRLDEDCEAQQRGYAWLVCEKYPTVQKVRACVLRPRLSEHEWYEWTRESLLEWLKDLAKTVWANQYRPNPLTCQYCQRLSATGEDQCREGIDAMRSAVRIITEEADDYAMTFFSPVLAVQLARAVKRKCEEIESWARAAVESAGGRIEGEEHELVLTPTDRERISFGPAEPILRNTLGVDLPNVVEVGKGKLEAALKAKAGKGKGAKLIRDVFEQLNDVGAVDVETVHRMEIKRKPKLIPQEV